MNSPGPHRGMPPRLSRWILWVAGCFVPRGRRSEWRRQWHAELQHRWHHVTGVQPHPVSARSGVVLWSIGAIFHAAYLTRHELTMESFLQDFRFGLRSLRNGWGLIVIAVISLSLGIGINAAIFSAVDIFMLQPLPYTDTDELHALDLTNPPRGWTDIDFSVPDFLDVRSQSTTLDVAVLNQVSFNLAADHQPERITAADVSHNFFRVLDVTPALGRSFVPQEEYDGANQVVILSDGLWHRSFGADPNLVGTDVLLDNVPHTIIGVMGESFWFRNRTTDLWRPLGVRDSDQRNSYFLDATIARRRPGFGRDQAAEELLQISRNMAAEFPATNAENVIYLRPLRDEVFGEGFLEGSLISTVAVAFVLLISCANVANLLLTRSAGRTREVALRSALGAGRSRIVRQFLTEATIIAGLGGILGLGVAWISMRGLTAIMPADFPRVEEIGLSGRVLLYMAALSVGTGLLFGMAPALQTGRTNVTDALREGGRSETGASGGRLRKALVVFEIGLALILLIGSTLLVRGYLGLTTADLGFETADRLTFRVTLPPTAYPDGETTRRAQEQFEQRLAALPGAGLVGATSSLPLFGNSNVFYTLPGDDYSDEPNARPVVSYRIVSPDYFATVDVPVLRGRAFNSSDVIGSPNVAIINEAFAERHWDDADPIGQQIHLTSGPVEIVGVTANTLDAGAEEGPFPMLFLNLYQRTVPSLSWIVKTEGQPTQLIAGVRSALGEVDPSLALYQVQSFDEHIDMIMFSNGVMGKLMSAIAIVALILSLGGVYGVMAYMVTQRRKELGLRMALGAGGSDVLGLVVRQGVKLAAIGTGLGLVLSLGVTRGLSFFLFGISPFDPLTFISVTVALMTAGLVASYVPARRATKVDPIIALRAD